MHRRPLACSTAAYVALHLQWASAATPSISLSIVNCNASGVTTERLFELARAELAPRPLLTATDPDARHAEIRLCDGSTQHARISMKGNGAPRGEQRLELTDVTGDLRARTLAIAFAEWITANDANPTRDTAIDRTAEDASQFPPSPNHTSRSASPSADPDPAVAALSPTGAASPALAAPAGRTAKTTTQLAAGLALRHHFTTPTNLAGPWLAFTHGGWHTEAQLLSSNSDHPPQGSVTLYDAHVALAYPLAQLMHKPAVAIRARAELGWAWAQGDASAPTLAFAFSRSTWQAAVLLEVPAQFCLSQHIGILTRFEVGASRGLTAQVDHQSVATTQGLFAGVALGVVTQLL